MRSLALSAAFLTFLLQAFFLPHSTFAACPSGQSQVGNRCKCPIGFILQRGVCSPLTGKTRTHPKSASGEGYCEGAHCLEETTHLQLKNPSTGEELNSDEEKELAAKLAAQNSKQTQWKGSASPAPPSSPTTPTYSFEDRQMKIFCYTEVDNYRDCVSIQMSTPNGSPMPKGFWGNYDWVSQGATGRAYASAKTTTVPPGYTNTPMHIYCVTIGSNYRDCIVFPKDVSLPANGIHIGGHWVDMGYAGYNLLVGSRSSQKTVPGYTRTEMRMYCYNEAGNYKDCVVQPIGTANGSPLPMGYWSNYDWRDEMYANFTVLMKN